jgi:hypothetical protein
MRRRPVLGGELAKFIPSRDIINAGYDDGEVERDGMYSRSALEFGFRLNPGVTNRTESNICP